jgi:hypothetical protein
MGEWARVCEGVWGPRLCWGSVWDRNGPRLCGVFVWPWGYLCGPESVLCRALCFGQKCSSILFLLLSAMACVPMAVYWTKVTSTEAQATDLAFAQSQNFAFGQSL